MLTLPQEMMKVILPFVDLFSERVWDYAGFFSIQKSRELSSNPSIKGAPSRSEV